MKNKVFVDLHVIQSVPPSCLNRDDTGSPKTAMYGGVCRARVSSQAWKHAMREMFKENFDEFQLGKRTLNVFDFIADEITKQVPDMAKEDALVKAIAVLDKVGVKKGKKGNKVDALFFIGAQQAKNLAALALGGIGDKAAEKEILSIFKNQNAVDTALFGRMVAANPLLNCDASAQVAHAISTHRVENEYDFFTAVDDSPLEDHTHAGAGMMGTVEYNSATLYRYATVAAHELFLQLAGDSMAFTQAVREFTRAFVNAMPSGKQNTFAANTLPDAVMAVIRTDRPINLAGAFEKPIPYGDGFVSLSVKALEKYASHAYNDFCGEPQKTYLTGQYFDKSKECLPFNHLLEQLGQDAAELVIQ